MVVCTINEPTAYILIFSIAASITASFFIGYYLSVKDKLGFRSQEKEDVL